MRISEKIICQICVKKALPEKGFFTQIINLFHSVQSGLCIELQEARLHDVVRGDSRLYCVECDGLTGSRYGNDYMLTPAEAGSCQRAEEIREISGGTPCQAEAKCIRVCEFAETILILRVDMKS